jgi:hypothetical protein
MDNLKTMMEKIDEIKEKMTDEAYVILSDEMKKLYEKEDKEIHIRVKKITTETLIFANDTAGHSRVIKENRWRFVAKDSPDDYNDSDDENDMIEDLQQVEVKSNIVVTNHLLRVIESHHDKPDYNWDENTIQYHIYGDLIEKKYFQHIGSYHLFEDDESYFVMLLD